MLGELAQVRRYFAEPDLRNRIQGAVANQIKRDTRVVIGHSLGSVVAYEALCRNDVSPLPTLITLGSPLGIRKIVFDRLTPRPVMREGHPVGRWPGVGRAWVNICDERDIVSLVKDLKPLFGSQLQQAVIDNGPKAHDVSPYLTSQETGSAVLEALSGDSLL